nr:hypothetical protein [Tanacetum cinerariifolium]
MYCPSYEPPASSPQPNQGYSPINRVNLDMDMKNLFKSQDYYAGQGSGGNHEFYTGQYYSMVHGSAPGSTPLKTTLQSKRWQRPSKLRSKWKNRVRSRIGAFCAIFDNVQRRNESGSCDLTMYQKKEVREVRPIGRDQAKKKAYFSSRSKSSPVVGGGLSDLEKATLKAVELKKQELEIKRKTLELKLRNKLDKDLLFYNS